MNTFVAPNGENIIIPSDRIITFGLSESQNQFVRNTFPIKDCELFVADIPTDLITISSSALIINANELDEDGRQLIFDYYTELGNGVTESLLWIGDIKPPEHLKKRFKCYNDFKELIPNLKYLLLSAHRKSKRACEFSRKLEDCIKILSFIRLNPGIKTRELSERMELSTRTVQRYINTLQAAGEWIEYDTTKKGWQLQYGISILFGDHLNC